MIINDNEKYISIKMYETQNGRERELSDVLLKKFTTEYDPYLGGWFCKIPVDDVVYFAESEWSYFQDDESADISDEDLKQISRRCEVEMYYYAGPNRDIAILMEDGWSKREATRRVKENRVDIYEAEEFGECFDQYMEAWFGKTPDEDDMKYIAELKYMSDTEKSAPADWSIVHYAGHPYYVQYAL